MLPKSERINPNVAVIIPARNEEEFIGKILENLKLQSLTPHRIILINDGSTDKTREIAQNYNLEIIDREKTKEKYTKKDFAKTLNSGLEALEDEDNCDYIMILDADHIIPKDYIKTIVKKMEEDKNLVIASGVISGEYSFEPRHSGRITNFNFWKNIGLRYPINFGYEAYVILKARSMGYQVKIFEDVKSSTLRPSGWYRKSNPKTFYNWGVAMKALGYTFPYALIRSILFLKKSPKGAFYLFRGYISRNVNYYEKELRDYVRKNQYHNMLKVGSESWKHGIQLIKK